MNSDRGPMALVELACEAYCRELTARHMWSDLWVSDHTVLLVPGKLFDSPEGESIGHVWRDVRVRLDDQLNAEERNV